MNNIVPLNAGQMPAIFQSMGNLPDMNAAAQAGISAGFAVIGYKGRNWRLKHGGNDIMVTDDRGAPKPTLDVVIVGVSAGISKIWYEKRYTEGDDAAPDCWSVDGVKPEPTSPKLQSTACATCPHNAWGSRITDSGKKGKSCQDSRRIAVVPEGDIENSDFGGPMLLRIPPMSLANLSAYANEIKRFGAQPFMVRTELGFNYDVAYPHLTFRALGWLDADQAAQVAEQMRNPLIDRILYDDLPAGEAPQADAATSALAGGPPAHVQAQAAPPPRDAAMAQTVQQDATDREAQHQAQRQAEQAQRDRIAREQAEAAQRQAAAEAQRQQDRDAAAAEAARQAQAAPTPAKGTPFGGKKTVATTAQATSRVAAQTPPTAQVLEAEPQAQPIQTVQPAPDDMEAAIDALLG